MAAPFIGEIRAFAFNFPPTNWLTCNGQLLPISQYQALFAVIGTSYGGDGKSDFALPNMQGNVPMGWGQYPGGLNTTIGQVQGTPGVTLTTPQMPAHQHTINAATVPSGAGVDRSPGAKPNSFLSDGLGAYAWQKNGTPDTPFGAAISIAGGSQPHENRQPFLVVNFCIAYGGFAPTHN